MVGEENLLTNEKTMENNNESSTSGIVIGVLVLVVVAIVAWLAYSQGLFTGGAANQQNDDNNNGSLEIKLETPDTTGQENPSSEQPSGEADQPAN